MNRSVLLLTVFLTAILSPLAFSMQQLIMPGNVIQITVLGYPELSKEVLVKQDGSTDYPLLSNIPIDGMTIQDLNDLLQPIVARYVERPKVFVSISELLQLVITVQGQVMNPGIRTVKGPIDVQGVISLAGGATPLADLRNVRIIRQKFDDHREFTVDLYKYFTDNEPKDIPRVESGDIIFIPMLDSFSYIRVLGAVREPGRYLNVKDENLLDMIYMAGGTSTYANLKKVTFISSVDGRLQSRMIDIAEMVRAGRISDIPPVKPGDVIIVAELSQWQRTNWWVQVLRDTALILSSFVILSRL